MAESISTFFSTLCYESLVEEVITTPKPGLVDTASSGAHSDMNIIMFMESSRTISPYLGDMAKLGYQREGTNEEIFEGIQKIGINAERAMYTATNGINTHKGAIFSLGILVTAAGCLLREGYPFSTNDLFEKAKNLCKNYLDNKLSQIQLQNAPTTNGEKLFCQNKISGARGEAMHGFPSVRTLCLPVIHEMLDEHYSFNDAKVQALLVLMKEVKDTTVLSRVGLVGLQTMQNLIAEILQNGGARNPENIAYLYRLDTVFTDQNISAGGCADLLSLTILVHKLERKQKKGLLVFEQINTSRKGIPVEHGTSILA